MKEKGNISVNIEDYLTKEEIKEIVTEEIKIHIKTCVGNVSVGYERAEVLLRVMAKDLAKNGVQELIPNFKELINEHIKTEIAKLTLSDFFTGSMGWRSDGNKLFNSVLSDNKELIDAKIKEIFKTL